MIELFIDIIQELAWANWEFDCITESDLQFAASIPLTWGDPLFPWS